MKKGTFEIDITPSWRFAVKGLFAVLESHLKKSLKYKDVCEIREQLLQCSDVADNAVAFSDEIKQYHAKLEQQDKDQKYYGYTNKVTHTVMSMIDNDEGLRDHFMSWSKVCLIEDADKHGLNKITLGQSIKDHFLDQKPTISKDSFTLDHYNESMLSWAYDMVNWEEIAEHILDAVAEETE